MLKKGNKEVISQISVYLSNIVYVNSYELNSSFKKDALTSLAACLAALAARIGIASDFRSYPLDFNSSKPVL